LTRPEREEEAEAKDMVTFLDALKALYVARSHMGQFDIAPML
jgi:hypothetical protein